MPDNPILDYSDTVVYERQRLPYQDTDGALTRAADAVVGAVGQARVENLQQDLTGATDEFIGEYNASQQALEGPMSEDVIARALGTDKQSVGAADEAIKPVLAQLARLKLAEEQGTLDPTELKIRHEDILRRAVARMPAFASELIQAAGETLGYNPIGSQLESIEASLRASGDGSTAPKNEVEKYYDEQADKLAIDRTQKWSDPVGYYTKVQREISLNEVAQHNVRTLGQMTTTRQINEEGAFDMFRTQVVPSLYNRFVGQLVNQAREFAKQSAAGLGQSIESGALRNFQTEILRAKQGITEAIQASPMSNYLTQERIQQATASVNSMLDEAAKAADPVAALNLVKQVLEAQTLNRVDLQNPNLGALRAMFSDIGRLPSGSLIASNTEAKVADAAVLALVQAYGGVFNSDQAFPQSVVPPSVQLKIPERLKAEKQAAQIMNELASETTQDLASVRATIRGLGVYAQQYLNNKKGGVAPPRAEARQWLQAMAKETWYKNVSQPGISSFELANSLVPYAEMMSDEAIDIGYDMQDAMASEGVRYTTQMSNPSGRRGLERNRRIPGSATVGDFVTLEWKDGKVVVVPMPEANPNIRISGDSLNKAVAKIQNQVSGNATLIVKSAAHMNAAIRGTPVDYEATLNAPLTEGGRSLLEIMMAVPMEDIAGGN